MKFFHRLCTQFRKVELDQELSEELAFHIEKETEENIALGMSAEEARFAALRKFGGIDQVKEECRDAWGMRFIDMLLQDLRFGLRQLKRSPGFTAVAVITLALGIGANSAVFSVLNGLFLRGLPVPAPERLLSFSDTNFSWADYITQRDQTRSFENLSASYAFPFTANLNSTRPPQHIYGGLVTGNFVSTLGIKPALGRGFLPDEDQISSPKPVVMLSYQFWRTRFGGDPGVVGQQHELRGCGRNAEGTSHGGYWRRSRPLGSDGHSAAT
jgi:putative ABC transport system permease protein